MNPNEFLRRIDLLVFRGLAMPVAHDLWMAGDESLIAQVEGATDAQIQKLNERARSR